MKIAEPCPLIDPSQVVVTQGEILTADPVLTPIGTFLKHFAIFVCVTIYIHVSDVLFYYFYTFAFNLHAYFKFQTNQFERDKRVE